MIKLIKDLIFALRYKHAVRKANRLHRLSHHKYMVISLNGRLRVTSKQQLKLLIAQRKFKKGTRIQDIEELALYTTL